MNSNPRRSAFPFVIVLIFIAYWFGIRAILHVPLQPVVGGETASTGILLNCPDNLAYASWAQQARAGTWLMNDLY